MDEDEVTAFHEAAHCVVGLYYSVSIRDCSVERHGTAAGFARFLLPRASSPLQWIERHMAMLYAGTVCVRFRWASYPAEALEDDAQGDLAAVDDMIEKFAPGISATDREQLIDRAIDRAQASVSQLMSTIEAVAVRLRKERSLGLGELSSTFAKHLPDEMRVSHAAHCDYANEIRRPTTMNTRKKRKRQHGTGGIYKRGDSYLIKWREGGRQRYKTFTTEELARKALAKITGDVQSEGVGLPVQKPPAPSLTKLAEKWMQRRKVTHRSAGDDAGRWSNHLQPFFGKYSPDEVDPAMIRQFVEDKIAKKMNTATVGLCVRLLSTFFTDLVEQGYTEDNPVKRLRRSTRRLYRPTHDPRSTPFLEQIGHVRTVFLMLPELYGVMFAVGALGGMRTGEVLALSWDDVDMDTQRILVHRQVRHGNLGPLKDDESRLVPIQAALHPILKAWKLKTGGKGFMFRPAVAGRGRRSRRGTAFIKDQTLNDRLRVALKACELNDKLTWYEATRHTFASLWVLGGGSIEKLSKILGHSDIRVTMRYAHLRVDLFTDADHQQIKVDLARPAGVVVDLPPQQQQAANGCTVVTREVEQESDSAVGG